MCERAWDSLGGEEGRKVERIVKRNVEERKEGGEGGWEGEGGNVESITNNQHIRHAIPNLIPRLQYTN